MTDAFLAVPARLTAFSTDQEAEAAAITAEGSADSAAMVGAAAAALGPIGAIYLAAFAPALANNLAGTLLVGAVHASIGAATDASRTAIVATDNA